MSTDIMPTPIDPLAQHPLLEAMLPVAVLTALDEVAGLTAAERRRLASEAATIIGSHGDDLMFGGKHTGDAFATLARALAVLAHQPGGVSFAGLHWCVGSGHHGTRDAAPCAAERAAEQVSPASAAETGFPPRDQGSTA
ncbi:hypothetical protein L3Q67_26645 [Saccharothrix sp. AJ9571]|nr:hypothetical protein L3Q67_26645 [Saccharothrix sp. AJ9571]